MSRPDRMRCMVVNLQKTKVIRKIRVPSHQPPQLSSSYQRSGITNKIPQNMKTHQKINLVHKNLDKTKPPQVRDGNIKEQKTNPSMSQEALSQVFPKTLIKKKENESTQTPTSYSFNYQRRHFIPPRTKKQFVQQTLKRLR